MKGPRLPQDPPVQLVGPQPHVGPRVAVEQDLVRVLIGHGEEGHAGSRLRVVAHPAYLDLLLPQHFCQVMAKGIVAHLADEGAPRPQPRRRHRHVGRRAARLGPEGRHLLQASTQLGGKHVDQDLAQTNDIHPMPPILASQAPQHAPHQARNCDRVRGHKAFPQLVAGHPVQ